jgi:Mor family transcriptional regulator
MGGALIYMPRDLSAKIATRDAQIFAEYEHTPESVSALARRFGLSEVHVYRVLEKQRQLRLAALPN